MTDPTVEPSNIPVSNGKKRIALWVWKIISLVLILFLCASWYASYVFSPGPPNSARSVIVTIPKGTSVRGIGEILARDGVIRSDIRFLLLAKFSGLGTKLQAGEFELAIGRRPGEVLEALANAKPVQYAITIPEGLRVVEIAEIFGKDGWCDPDEFIKLTSDKQYLQSLGFEQLSTLDSLEGYLFPDTYFFTKDINGADKIISFMVGRFVEVWKELTTALEEQPDLVKTVTLASIVEKETGTPEERSLIAGVFLNRLRLGMRLQSDPTVVYGSQNFLLPITKSDLQTPTPYNTYTLPGLPMGPICNPGKDALHAVFYPTPTLSLYFVSKNDGTHYFSETLAEHNRAVQKYQRK